MKIPGQDLNGHVGQLARRLDKSRSNVTEAEDVLCEAKVVSKNVFLEAHSPFDRERPMRPYLHIIGECTGIKSNFAYGVTDLDFSEAPVNVDYFYEFTNDELADLAKKGLFDKGFRVPDIMFGNEFYFPVTCDLLTVAPEAEGEPPIIFAAIKDAHDRITCSKDCGYDFARDNFEATPEEDKHDEFIDDVEDTISVEDSMFRENEGTEAEILAVESVEESPEDVHERAHLEAQYALIRERVKSGHMERKMAQDEVVDAHVPTEEEEQLFAERMAEHKELDPLREIEEVQVLEPVDAIYESADVEIAPAVKPDPLAEASLEGDEDVLEEEDPSVEEEEVSDTIVAQEPNFKCRSKRHEVSERIRQAAQALNAQEVTDAVEDGMDIDDAI